MYTFLNIILIYLSYKTLYNIIFQGFNKCKTINIFLNGMVLFYYIICAKGLKIFY